MTKSILLVGVGGQGTVLASDLLSRTLVAAGYDVKKSEIHGMAQRGGSVSSHIRYGEKVYAPVIGEGEADIMISFERLEALRYVHFMKGEGQVLVNDLRIPPPSAASMQDAYTDRIEAVCSQRDLKMMIIPGTAFGERAGDIRTTNVAVLGALSGFIDPPDDIWIQIIKDRFPRHIAEINQEAFRMGRDFGLTQK